MYQSGDLILYGNTGVCRITDISTQKLPGIAEEQLYYTLAPLFQECVIYTPVNNTKIFMRPIISKDEAERLIDMIPSIHAEVYYSKDISQLKEHYEASINSYDCADLFELTMSIYAKKQEMEEQKRKFGTVDERFLKRGEELLFGELAAALGIPRDEVPEYIASRVEALKKERKENNIECKP